MNEDYRMGFTDGFRAAVAQARNYGDEREYRIDEGKQHALFARVQRIRTEKRKVKQSPKQKLLTKMTAAKWNKYKKGRGKKTYVEIRAEVSRSQAFKKKAKRL